MTSDKNYFGPNNEDMFDLVLIGSNAYDGQEVFITLCFNHKIINLFIAECS